MAGPSAGPDWEGLQRGISGQVVLPGSDAYERARPLAPIPEQTVAQGGPAS